jgi:hypothetical protein
MIFATIRNLAEYRAEQFDCDDFSVTFATLARKWHARLRVALTTQSTVKQMLPAAPKDPETVRVLPHIPAADAKEDTTNIGGAPVGMCHGKLSASGGEHAFNFWINEKGDVVFIEPQTGEYITFGEGAVVDFVYI